VHSLDVESSDLLLALAAGEKRFSATLLLMPLFRDGCTVNLNGVFADGVL